MTGNSYPKEVIDYIAENYGERGTSISVDIERMFNVTIKPSTVHKIATRRLKIHYKPTPKVVKEPSYKRYTKKETEFILENHRKFKRMDDLVQALNEVGGNNRTRDSVSTKLYKLGISMKNITEDQYEWLRDNARIHTSRELAEMFFQEFGELHTSQTIRVVCYREGIHCLSDEESRFNHQRDWMTKHKYGETYGICNDHEYVRVRARSFGEKKDSNLIPRARFEYEKLNGRKLSSDEVVMFLDGDRRNYSKENLIAVSKYVAMKMGCFTGPLNQRPREVNRAYAMAYQIDEIGGKQ